MSEINEVNSKSDFIGIERAMSRGEEAESEQKREEQKQERSGSQPERSGEQRKAKAGEGREQGEKGTCRKKKRDLRGRGSQLYSLDMCEHVKAK